MTKSSDSKRSPNSAEAATERAQSVVPRYQPLVIVLVAVGAGIVVDRFWPLPVLIWWTAAVAACALWLGLWRRGWDEVAAVTLLLAVAAVAASWHHCRWFLFAEKDLGYFARAETQPVCVEATARKAARVVPAPEPDPMRAIPLGDRARLDLQLTAVRDGSRWRQAAGRTRLLVDGHLPGVRAGDRVRIFGQLSAPSGPRNPGGFDYAGYLRAEGIRSQLRSPFPECVSVLESGRGWGFSRLIEQTRAHGNRILERYLDRERSPLAAAVLLGARERLDPDRKQAFLETGTIHLLAISGLHVGILIGALLWLMRRLPIPRGRAMLTVAGFTLFYMLLTDARPPVNRASILILLTCLALYLYRRPLSFNSLAAAALIVLALNPAELFHTGAQLSFLAVAGLMWFGPHWIYPGRQDPLDRLIAERRGWLPWMLWLLGRTLRRLTLVSAMIWLLTLPLVMARFHLLTPIAVLMNTVLWIPMAAALMSGFATLIFGSLAEPFGHAFGTCCDANLWLLQSSATFARHIPGSHFWVPGPADWWLVGFYGGLAVLAAFPRLRPPRRWCLGLLAGWSALGFAAAAVRHDESRLECTFLAVGHGCAVVLELPSGQTMLYDAGQFGSPVAATRSIAEFLWSRGITHLDALVLSHSDLDHYNALPGLFERFSVGVIYVSPVMFEEKNAPMAALQEAIRRSGVPLREIHAGDRFSGGDGCRIEVLHPPRRGVLGGDNPNSIVLDVQYAGHRILLPGDLDSPGLEDVLAEEPTDCDVLLAPHHGSRRSNPTGLAGWCTPEWVVISGGRRWDLGPIRKTYEAAGCQVLHTADTGAVDVTIDAMGVTVAGYLTTRQ